MEPPADSRNFLNYFNTDSISTLVSHDYFPVLTAPVTLPHNCIWNSRGKIKMRKMFLQLPQRQAEVVHLVQEASMEDLLF